MYLIIYLLWKGKLSYLRRLKLLLNVAKQVKNTTMQKDKIKFLLDPGHGGMIDGEYQTAGKRSPVWKDGSQLFEGVFNREIAENIFLHMRALGYDVEILVPEQEDISLGERVRRANEKHINHKNCVYISIHANAGGGTGFEIFTSEGETISDKYATHMFIAFLEDMKELKPRKDTVDGDPDKEAPFYVLRKTACPAILIECAFMDTYEPDCKLMMSKSGKQRFAAAIIKGLIAINNGA